MKLLDCKKLTIKDSNSVVSLEYPTKGWGERFLCIEQKKAYWLGYPCGTCNFVFEKLIEDTRKVSPYKLLKTLSSKIVSLNDEKFEEIIKIIPDGNYIALLLKITPNLIKSGSKNDYFVTTENIHPSFGSPHHPKVNYYMDSDIKINDSDTFHTFILPIVLEDCLDENTVEKYKREISNDDIQPTAIALSYLDITERKEKLHTCFVNILLDGHHKTFAASGLRNTKPIYMVSFLSMDMGVSTEGSILEYINHLSNC